MLLILLFQSAAVSQDTEEYSQYLSQKHRIGES